VYFVQERSVHLLERVNVTQSYFALIQVALHD